MKTPEQLADDYAACWTSEQLCELKDAIGMLVNKWQQEAFLAGYQAAKDTYKDAIETYEDVAKQMLEEAVHIMSPKEK